MKTIRFNSTRLHFPTACLVCLGPDSHTYPLERTFTFGNRSIVLRLLIPLCHTHHQHATLEAPVQRWIRRLSPVAGLGLAALVCLGLLNYWSATGQGAPGTNLLLAGFAGLSLGLCLWLAGIFWIAPLFASAQTRSVWRSVQMSRYDPFRQVLELTFANETAAELTVRENLTTWIPDSHQPLQAYQISAHLLDHDIRFSGRIQTRVLLSQAPTESEARELLQPVVEKVLVQQLGVDTLPELSDIRSEATEVQAS